MDLSGTVSIKLALDDAFTAMHVSRQGSPKFDTREPGGVCGKVWLRAHLYQPYRVGEDQSLIAEHLRHLRVVGSEALRLPTAGRVGLRLRVTFSRRVSLDWEV
jgi:hypothetical protein